MSEGLVEESSSEGSLIEGTLIEEQPIKPKDNNKIRSIFSYLNYI